MAELSIADADLIIAERGWLPDIGQIPPAVLTHLRRRRRVGEIGCYQGHWNTGLPNLGMGPLKTIYAKPEIVETARELAWIAQ